MSKKLFAVYLGGRAPKSNTELHDVVFAVGETIEETYEQLLDKWFGAPQGLHLDSWVELDVVDGHKVTITNKKQNSSKKLYFINLGAYREGEFIEYHANKFLVAENVRDAKSKGKLALFKGWPSAVHTDDLYDIDDCLEITGSPHHYVSLEKTNVVENLKPTNGYHLIPKPIVQEYIDRKMARKKT